MLEKISYSAVVLDDKSHKFLVKAFKTIIPKDWEVIAHHMTVILGKPLPDNLKDDLDKKVQLTVKELGVSEKAIAVKVVGYFSKNKIPHITVAIDRKGGGKPVDSTKIENWVKIKSPFKLSGTVEEVKSD